MASGYIGRFAPSPTGPLHFGSLVAALASFLDARANRGRWLVRMEDLDPPREIPGAATQILDQLRQHGLSWDGDVLFQSRRHQRYQEIIDQFFGQGMAYYCNCSRHSVREMGGIYNSHCFERTDLGPADSAAVRIHLNGRADIGFQDGLQGWQSQNLRTEVGDFIIRRRDRLYAYQLAVVVDDWDQGITHIVRGIDLMASTFRQIWLQQQLGAPQPVYSHIPVAKNRIDQKLSKQHHAPSLSRLTPTENLRLALDWLGIPQPGGGLAPEAMVNYAVSHWQPKKLKGLASMPAPKPYGEAALAEERQSG